MHVTYYILTSLFPHGIDHVSQETGSNNLQPTGHVMDYQFNIQQLYALPTLYLCVLYLSENTATYSIN